MLISVRFFQLIRKGKIVLHWLPINFGTGTPETESLPAECISKLKLKQQKKRFYYCSQFIRQFLGRTVGTTAESTSQDTVKIYASKARREWKKKTNRQNHAVEKLSFINSICTAIDDFGEETWVRIRNGWTWPILCDDDDHDAIGNGEKGIPFFFFCSSFADKNNAERRKKKKKKKKKRAGLKVVIMWILKRKTITHIYLGTWLLEWCFCARFEMKWNERTNERTSRVLELAWSQQAGRPGTGTGQRTREGRPQPLEGLLSCSRSVYRRFSQ